MVSSGLRRYGGRHGPEIGWNERRHIQWATATYLHGRAKGFFKGRMLGSALSERNPFKVMRATAFLDGTTE
ncbi:MAG: hypothetical protein R3C68_17595 [Myxococcota bacterium]